MASPDHTHTNIPDEGRRSGEPSTESSGNPSRESSRPPKPKKGVRFTPGGESLDPNNQRAAFDVRDESDLPPRPSIKPRPYPKQTAFDQRSHSEGSTPNSVDSDLSKDVTESPRPKQAQLGPVREQSPGGTDVEEEVSNNGLEMGSMAAGRKAYSERIAQDRAQRLSRTMGSHSAPGSRTTSPFRISPLESPPPSPSPDSQEKPLDLENIPLEKLQSRRTYGIEDSADEDDEKEQKSSPPVPPQKLNSLRKAAARLVRHHTRREPQRDGRTHSQLPYKVSAPPTPLRSGQTTPVREQNFKDYVPRPHEYREGFLSSILKLYNEQGAGAALSNAPVGNVGSASGQRRQSTGGSIHTREGSSASSGTTTPKAARQKWYKNQQASSTGSLSNLISSATVLAHPGGSPATEGQGPRPSIKSRSVSALDTVLGRNKGPKTDDSIHIQVHIAETMTRQAYLMKMCRALMNYGAPTHRLEGKHGALTLHRTTDSLQNKFVCLPEYSRLRDNFCTFQAA